MPISDAEGYPAGHFTEVYSELIKPAVESAGYTPTRADEVVSSNMIHIDVISKIVHADLCVCDLSSKNPNVMFEYGIRQAFDKPTVLIKDTSTTRIFDLSGFRDIEYDTSLRVGNILKKRNEIKDAILETIQNQGTDGNVFSLVSLLGLANAAQIPTSNADPEAAQFQIIMKQISALQEIINSKIISNDSNYLQKHRNKTQPLGSQDYTHIYDGNLQVSINREMSKVKIFDTNSKKIYNLNMLDKIPIELEGKLSREIIQEIYNTLLP